MRSSRSSNSTKMKLFSNISRIITGLVFIFSGFVKGVDPLGTVFQMKDYFAAFGIPWAGTLALPLTLILVTLEFSIGVSLFFNLWIKGTAWALLPLMIYFTILTLFNYLYNLVPECGCFGDAVRMTNLETFLKNIVLMVLVIPIFLYRKKFRGLFHAKGNTLLLVIFAAGFAGMSVYAVRHLPLIDFMDWKVGNNVVKREPATPVKFYVTYKNKATGETKEFLTPNYPWNDSVWMSQWTFVSQRTDEPEKSHTLVLRIEDENGNDMTPVIIGNPDLQFILVAWDLDQVRRDNLTRILLLAKKAANDGFSFICVTNLYGTEVRSFKMSNGALFDFYTADDVVLKTMVRSNPGLILLRNGVVLKKWHYNDFPEYGEILREFGGK